MSWRNKFGVFLLVTLTLFVASSVESRPRRMQRLSTSSWGGPNIRMEVGARTTRIEYSCANSTIAGPLTFDSKGRFTWHGDYYREGPGPVRADATSDRVTYTGTVKGDTMTLTVKLAGSSDALDTFTLKRGGIGRVFKCK